MDGDFGAVIVALASIALAVQIISVSVVGWSLVNAVEYVVLVKRQGITNGRRIAAFAILWRSASLAACCLTLIVMSVLVLLSGFGCIWSVGVAASLVVAGAALLFAGFADVYERNAMRDVV